jgi:DNA-directed RNA polymerase specialized sigma24 family protein
VNINLETLESLSQKYYSFAFILLPEELMATQLLIDAATKLCLNHGPVELTQQEVENRYVLAIYELAQSRQQHFQLNPEGPFYRLSLEQRAVIFLRDKREWSIEEISQSLGLNWDRLYGSLNLGRNRLMNMTISTDQEGAV